MIGQRHGSVTNICREKLDGECGERAKDLGGFLGRKEIPGQAHAVQMDERDARSGPARRRRSR